VLGRLQPGIASVQLHGFFAGLFQERAISLQIRQAKGWAPALFGAKKISRPADL
jgi:hypothetical protein